MKLNNNDEESPKASYLDKSIKSWTHLDNELQNNQGTITELAEKVLEESDWELGQCDILTQFIIEPLYELVYVDNASPSNPMIGIGSLPNINSVEVENNDKIYVPYSVLTEKKDYFQFLFHNLKNLDCE